MAGRVEGRGYDVTTVVCSIYIVSWLFKIYAGINVIKLTFLVQHKDTKFDKKLQWYER